jgi:hypothetical protein
MRVSPKCRPCWGFLVIAAFVSHGFPFPSFRASAVGYVVASLRDSRQHEIGPLQRSCKS